MNLLELKTKPDSYFTCLQKITVEINFLLIRKKSYLLEGLEDLGVNRSFEFGWNVVEEKSGCVVGEWNGEFIESFGLEVYFCLQNGPIVKVDIIC